MSSSSSVRRLLQVAKLDKYWRNTWVFGRMKDASQLTQKRCLPAPEVPKDYHKQCILGPHPLHGAGGEMVVDISGVTAADDPVALL